MENNIGDARRNYADMVGGFTQKDAADYFKVSLSTYKKWEQGQGMMNGYQLRDIAEKYGVTVDYLLKVDRPKPKAAATTPDERELIALYRNMDADKRQTLLETARAFSALSEKDGADGRVVERIGTVDAVR